MEFLDDLRNRREAKSSPEDKPSIPEAPDIPAPPSLAPESQDLRGDLLDGVSFDEPIAVEQESSRTQGSAVKRTRRFGLTLAQRIVLGALVLIVLALWAVVVLYMTGAFRTRIVDPGMIAAETATAVAASLADSTDSAPEDQIASPTVAATPMPVEESGAPGTPAPTGTPVPAGPVPTEYDEQLRKDPSNVVLYIKRGNEYLNVGAFQAALQDFRSAQQLDNGQAVIYQGLGLASYYLFQWKDAEAAFSEAIAINQDLTEAHFGLGRLAYYSGAYREAARQFDAAAEINPQKAEYEAWLAIAAAQLDDDPEALGAAARALSVADDLSIVYIAESWARRIQDPPDLDGAQSDLLYALDLAPNDSFTLHAVAQFYVENRAERLAEAEQLAVYALNWAANDVDHAVALQILGRVYLMQDRKADAERVLGQAAEMASVDGEIVLAGLAEALAVAKE